MEDTGDVRQFAGCSPQHNHLTPTITEPRDSRFGVSQWEDIANIGRHDNAMTRTLAPGQARTAVGPLYTPIRLSAPKQWVLYASTYGGHVKRLVVFVHGFMGSAVETWLDFPDVGKTESPTDWWQESDLLFVGYRSTKDDITGVANRIRQNLPRFYPQPPASLLTLGGKQARSDVSSPYDELVIVGHSLGGLILRRALSDAARQWEDAGRDPAKRPPLLDAKNRLFSPASSGFRAAGLLGLIRAVKVWTAIEMVARRASAYTDLQPESPVLREIKLRTERFAPDKDQTLSALRANIVWASPDNVVIAERYTTDFDDASWDDTTHTSVCKPRVNRFDLPWTFVSTGNAK